MNIDVVKYKIILLAPRSFGEGLCETFMSKILHIDKSDDGTYDLKSDRKVESKFSRALRKVDLSDLIKYFLSPKLPTFVDSAGDEEFLCNIQQIKTELFDLLYYGVFFNDYIYIFSITPEKIKSDKNLGYSDKQHRGNKGEGQFHIKRENFRHHVDNYLKMKLTWEEFVQILKKNT